VLINEGMLGKGFQKLLHTSATHLTMGANTSQISESPQALIAGKMNEEETDLQPKTVTSSLLSLQVLGSQVAAVVHVSLDPEVMKALIPRSLCVVLSLALLAFLLKN
jgi:hypothetical protein